MGANIRRILDISDEHLPPEWREDVYAADGEIPGCFVMRGTVHGQILLWVPDDPERSAADSEEAPPIEVLALQLYARRHGCDYVLFDPDAEINSDLDTFECDS